MSQKTIDMIYKLIFKSINIVSHQENANLNLHEVLLYIQEKCLVTMTCAKLYRAAGFK